MPDPTYVIATSGKKIGLMFHLTTAFYPAISHPVQKAMMDAFILYWDGEIDLEELDLQLINKAGYFGGLERFGFHHFLNTEDIN